jgi:hypothetical protein
VLLYIITLVLAAKHARRDGVISTNRVSSYQRYFCRNRTLTATAAAVAIGHALDAWKLPYTDVVNKVCPTLSRLSVLDVNLLC